MLTDTVLCLRPRSLPPLTLPRPLVTPSFPETPRNGAPCSITPVSSNQLPLRAVSRSGAHSILWSWSICWSTTLIEYLALLVRQPILDQKEPNMPLPPLDDIPKFTNHFWFKITGSQYQQRLLCNVLRRKDQDWSEKWMLPSSPIYILSPPNVR